MDPSELELAKAFVDHVPGVVPCRNRLGDSVLIQFKKVPILLACERTYPLCRRSAITGLLKTGCTLRRRHPASDSAMDLRRYPAVVTKYTNIEARQPAPGANFGSGSLGLKISGDKHGVAKSSWQPRRSWTGNPRWPHTIAVRQDPPWG